MYPYSQNSKGRGRQISVPGQSGIHRESESGGLKKKKKFVLYCYNWELTTDHLPYCQKPLFLCICPSLAAFRSVSYIRNSVAVAVTPFVILSEHYCLNWVLYERSFQELCLIFFFPIDSCFSSITSAKLPADKTLVIKATNFKC